MNSRFSRLWRTAMLLLGALQASAHAQAPAEPAATQAAPETPANAAAEPAAESQATATPVPTDQVVPLDAKEPLPPGFVIKAPNALRRRIKPPSRRLSEGLADLEQQLRRYQDRGKMFASTAAALLKRQHVEQRSLQEQRLTVQIRREEAAHAKAREKTIAQLEVFVDKYPTDVRYTADAMFRLGELYFERAQLRFQEQTPSESDGQPNDTPDYSATVAVYKRLASQFPDYGYLDGVYYLIGFCLNEMGDSRGAMLAWRALVCANQYPFDAASFDATPQGEEQAETAKSQHPALELGAKLGREEEKPLGDVYASCQPVKAKAQFLSETWFRIGEYHFDDYRDPKSLPNAVSAYQRMLGDPTDRNYNLALYKVAWAYYRSSRYAEAINNFGRLVQWSDDRQAQTGEMGSELRPEAVQYLGISFAYDDWNDNQVPDAQEGGKTTLERIQDPALLPQDRGWTPEVYIQAGDIFFDEAKYQDAIAVWRMATERWPMYRKVPEVIDKIAQAHARNNELELATSWRAKLTDYKEGSAWWNANAAYPDDQRRAELLTENGIMQSAIFAHQRAQQMRRQCVAESDTELCQAAQRQYAIAADSYQRFLDTYPNSPQAYELHYNLADALYWSEDYEGAAREYAMVRDSNLDNRFLPEAARRVVEARKRLLEIAEEKGELQVRAEPPLPAGAPPRITSLPMPERVQQLANAREMYIARVASKDDRENVLEAYDFNDALLLYMYGYWFHAKERFERIFAKRCAGPEADETGRVAWLNLRNMAVARNDTDEVERMGKLLSDRACTFAANGVPVANIDCKDTKNKDEPQCLAGADLVNVRYKRAVEVFQSAERAQGDEQQKLFERAAQMLVQAVNAEPNHPDAPLALEKAAVALERTNRFESAATLYQRIIDEVGPRPARDAEDQKRLDAILANAYFRLAYNSNRFFDFERAITNYGVLVNSKRFVASTDTTIQQKREDALINAAIALEWLQRYDQAAVYFQKAAETSRDEKVQRQARFRLAEMSFKRRDWTATVRAMQEFIRRYQRDKDAGELLVLAHWRIAQAQQSARPRGEQAMWLKEVPAAFARYDQQAGSMAAEYAANAAFQLADTGSDAFEDFTIKPRNPANLKAYVGDITKQIEDGSRRGKQFVDSYAEIPKYRRPTWTIAAFVRQGRVYEVLARAVLNTPFLMPADMQKQLRKLPSDQREEIRLQVEDRLRATLDEKVRPIECRAVARYALAARAARAGSLDNSYAQTAIDRLQAYGDERIAACMEEARKEDATLTAYEAGEFARAPRGRSIELTEGLAPPPAPAIGGKP